MIVKCLRTIRGVNSRNILFIEGNVYKFTFANKEHEKRYSGMIEYDEQGNKRWLTKKFYDRTFEKVIWR